MSFGTARPMRPIEGIMLSRYPIRSISILIRIWCAIQHLNFGFRMFATRELIDILQMPTHFRHRPKKSSTGCVVSLKKGNVVCRSAYQRSFKLRRLHAKEKEKQRFRNAISSRRFHQYQVHPTRDISMSQIIISCFIPVVMFVAAS